MRTTSLSAAVLQALQPELPALADEIIEAIRREVPEYARPMRGEFGRGIRTGVVEALRRFGTDAGEDHSSVYRALGRGELRVGRSLDALQSAYRIGARVAWRRLSRAAADAGIALEEQHALAEAIFAYIDELASESVEGYAAAQANLAGDLQRRRETLLALLLGPAPDEAVLAAAARDAGWRLPRTIAVLAVGRSLSAEGRTTPPNGGGEADPGALARRLSGDVLHGQTPFPVAVVPDPAQHVAEIETAAERLDVRVAVGPTVALTEARRSLDWAARGLALDGEVVIADQRLPDLILAALPEAMVTLRATALQPLDEETPNSRQRLEQTLRAWLLHAGARNAIAQQLGIHPQTVRYRVARLRELFGERLDDPDQRFALMLALR